MAEVPLWKVPRGKQFVLDLVVLKVVITWSDEGIEVSVLDPKEDVH